MYFLSNLMIENMTIKIITNRSFHSCYADFVNRYPSSKVDLITETTSTQAEPLGAVATLEKALKFCNQESNILLLAADNVFDFSLDAMMEFFNQTQGNVFGLYEVSLEDAIHHSVVDLENGKVIRYEEKPDVAFSNKIVTYCMILTRRTLNGIPEYLHRGGDRDGIGKFLVSTLPDIDLIAYPFEGKWFDIGSKSSFDAANRYFGK